MRHSVLPIDDLDLIAFIDGQSNTAERDRVATHLAADKDARARVATWRRQNEAIREAFSGVLVEPLPIALSLAGLTATRPTALPLAIPAAQPNGRRARGFVLGVLVGAACGIAAMSLPDMLARNGFVGVFPDMGRLRPSLPPRDAGTSLVSLAVDAYGAAIAQPSDLIPPGSAAQRLSRRLGGQVSPPNLDEIGFRMVGGRLVSSPAGQSGFVVYEGADGHRLWLFVQRLAANTIPFGEAPVATASWTRDGFGWVALGALPNTLNRVAQLAAQGG